LKVAGALHALVGGLAVGGGGVGIPALFPGMLGAAVPAIGAAGGPQAKALAKAAKAAAKALATANAAAAAWAMLQGGIAAGGGPLGAAAPL
jgi:hypothetical protein